MKLATTTGDYSLYARTQAESLEHIRRAGFRYADYDFCLDYARRDGVYGGECEKHIDSVNETAARAGITLVQAHSPMGKPLEDDGTFLADTLKCIDACGKLGIPNVVVHSGYTRGITREETFRRNRPCWVPR